MFFVSPPFSNYLNLPKLNQIKGSYTLEPRDGLILQILKTLRFDFNNNGWVNKIGLRNKGIDYAIKNYNGEIVSIAILNKKEIPKLLEKIPDNMNIEINISCPNAEKEMINDDIENFLNEERKWCILKLSPQIKLNSIDKFYNMGFRQFHCSNTIPVSGGGLSGKSIIPYNKKIICHIKNKYPDVTIIAGGGITDIKDIKMYKKLGADHYSFSSVIFCPYKFMKLYYDILNNL